MQKAIQIGYDELFAKKCKFAAQAGFRHIAVNFTKVLDKTEYQWQEVTEDIARILEENKLSCIQSHPYYYDLLISSEIREERYEFAIKQAIIATAKLGGAWCALHPRSSLSTGLYTSASFRDNQEDFGGYLELAVKHGTGIAAENLPIFGGIKPVIPFYSSNFEDLITFVDSFDDEKMGICWDTGHAHLMSFDQGKAIEYVGKRIVCTHVHNNDTIEDYHWPPDEGTIPWDKVMGAFAAMGYDGALTLETHCEEPTDENLLAFAKRNFTCLVDLERLMK